MPKHHAPAAPAPEAVPKPSPALELEAVRIERGPDGLVIWVASGPGFTRRIGAGEVLRLMAWLKEQFPDE